jgi:hypothetical protein
MGSKKGAALRSRNVAAPSSIMSNFSTPLKKMSKSLNSGPPQDLEKQKESVDRKSRSKDRKKMDARSNSDSDEEEEEKHSSPRGFFAVAKPKAALAREEEAKPSRPMASASPVQSPVQSPAPVQTSNLVREIIKKQRANGSFSIEAIVREISDFCVLIFFLENVCTFCYFGKC